MWNRCGIDRAGADPIEPVGAGIIYNVFEGLGALSTFDPDEACRVNSF